MIASHDRRSWHLTPAVLLHCSNGGEEIEKEACFVLGLLAIKPEHQHAIADRGALQVLDRIQ